MTTVSTWKPLITSSPNIFAWQVHYPEVDLQTPLSFLDIFVNEISNDYDP